MNEIELEVEELEERIAPSSANFPPGQFPSGNPAHAPGNSNPNEVPSRGSLAVGTDESPVGGKATVMRSPCLFRRVNYQCHRENQSFETIWS